MITLKRLLPFILIGIIAFLLRAPFTASVPASPYWEETILGFDAYSLAQTGKDHHGNAWPILALESFGDWKPAGYVYALLPFIKLFGLELWVVRLPSLLSGIAIVVGVALLSKKMSIPAWIGALVVAFSPWSIHFSRAAWEAHLATAYIVWAIFCAVSAVQKKSLNALFTISSVILFVLAWYTYHAARLIVPLLVIGIIVYGFVIIKSLSPRSYIKNSALAIVSAVLLIGLAIIPVLHSYNNSALSQRFSETSIFNDPTVVIQSNSLKDRAHNTMLSRLIYHRYVLWVPVLTGAYLHNLNPSFLFLTGEGNLRHTTIHFGLLYPFEAVLLLFGLFVWIRKRQPIHILFLYWLIVSLIPSALSTPTPHALRIMTALPVFSLLVAQGFYVLSVWLQRMLTRHSLPQSVKSNSHRMTVISMVLVYLISVSLYWHNYTQVYAKTSARFWQDGYQEMLSVLGNEENTYPDLPVYISRSEGRPASFLWFFRQTDPKQVQAVNATVKKDQGEYLEFEQYHFVRSPGEIPTGPALIVLTNQEFQEYRANHIVTEIAKIAAQNGEVVWMIGKQ